MAGAGGEQRYLTSGKVYTRCTGVEDQQIGLADRVKLEVEAIFGSAPYQANMPGQGYLTKSNIDGLADLGLDVSQDN